MPATDKIVLGTVQFGLDYGINNIIGKPDQASINCILDYSFEHGIRLLDTAEAYGDSQEAIGRYHSQSPNKFSVITKYGSGNAGLGVGLRDRIKKNIDTLGVKSLHGYMFHSFKDFTRYFPAFKNEIASLKKDGLISKFGVSIYTNEEALEVLKCDEVDFIQLPFNLLDNMSQRGAVLHLAKSRNVEVHSRSAFLQGLFFRELAGIPESLSKLIPHLGLIRDVATSNGYNLLNLSLNYALEQDGIGFVLIGVESVDQLKQNIDAIGPLKPQVLEEIDRIRVEDPSLLNPSTWKNVR